MDLGHRNDMINSTTVRMTTELWVNSFLSYGVGINVGKSGRDFKK